MRAEEKRRPVPLLHQILLRFFLVVLVGAAAAMVAYVVLRPIELEYALEDLAAEFESRLRDAGRQGKRRVVELEMDRRLLARLAAIHELHLRLVDPRNGHVLFTYDHDAAAPDVMTSILDWPPGFFELGEFDRDEEIEYGFIDIIRSPEGVPIKLVARRGPPVARDYYDWILAEFGYELLPMFLGVVGIGGIAATVSLRRAFAPLERISALARAIRPGTTTRLPRAGVPAEILPLVEAVNRALDRLQLAFERQRQFTAFAAHELRTPLAALRARIDGLPEELPEREALVRTIDRMARLVDQLLAVARLESGLVAPDEDVDLRGLLREVAEEFAPLAAARGRDLAVELPEGEVRARVHRDSLQRAVVNLLENAVKFSPPDGEVTLRLTPDGTIAVLDRGPGLDRIDSEELFRPFVRRRPRGDDPGGSGLGLAIVREVAEIHSGVARARPREGGGAVFELHIPVHNSASA